MTLVEPDLAGRGLERALSHGGDLAGLYAEDGGSLGLTIDDCRVEPPQQGS